MKDRIEEITKHYYTGNHLSSTQLVTDGTGVAVQQVEYAPFGEVVNEYNIDWSSGQVPDFKFNGKELDEENGMYYFEARYQSPPVFISRDPLFGKYPMFSPYAFCFNNPLNFIDPTGLDPYLVFNGETNQIHIYDNSNTPDDMSDDILLGTFDAHNNVSKSSNGKWEDGKYEMQDKTKPLSHGDRVDKNGVKKDSPNGEYGKRGIFRAKNFKETTSDKVRSGMGVHAGREHKKFEKRITLGCIRTTPEGMDAIQEAINTYGPLQSIYVANNRQSSNSDFVNNLIFGQTPAVSHRPIIYDIIGTILQDKTRVETKRYFIER